MTKKDVWIAVIGTFILLAIGGLILYPKKQAVVKVPPIDSATMNGPGTPPPTSHK